MQWSGNSLFLESKNRITSFQWSWIHSKVVVWITLESGFHYFESGFPLQHEVVPNMTPERVDIHSCRFIWYEIVEFIAIYRVSQKKRNGGFPVPCELNVLFLFRSLDQTSSAEEKDTKIIKFGWVVLILRPFLKIWSFSNFAGFLRPMSEELCRE